MYSSKPVHKNVSLFTSEGFLHGEPHGKKGTTDPRFSGKQFQVGRFKKDTFGDFAPLSVMPTSGKYSSDPYDKKGGAQK